MTYPIKNMIQNKFTRKSLIYIAVAGVMVFLLVLIHNVIQPKSMIKARSMPYYTQLEEFISDEDPLLYLNEDFTARHGFHTNLPIAVIHLDSEIQDYKVFKNSTETVIEDVEPWTHGTIALIRNDEGNDNRLTDIPEIVSDIRIKKRGHTSISFDKEQYYIKTIDENGIDTPVDIYGMGESDSWVLNGSMADKSMIRNYLSYRIAAEIMEYAPRCAYCEVFFEDNGVYTYQGTYLMTEAVTRDPTRILIDETKRKNIYTSYLIRRDRYTSFDTMLDETYARINDIDPGEWLGVKYPSIPKQQNSNLEYIREDYSNVERTIYSDNYSIFSRYDRYIDVDSFIDYFLINEFFGNYDAGEHSTYMYKNSGDKLHIGPVWDFDQAMNNGVKSEADPYTTSLQDRALYKALVKDTTFVEKLIDRYKELKISTLSKEHVFSLIDETTGYLSAAREREWFRWAADYLDGSFSNLHNYYLNDYIKSGVMMSRFNDDYDQEIYVIKVYLEKHAENIMPNLTEIRNSCDVTTGIKGQAPMMLFVILFLFLVPTVIVNRK